MTVVSVTTQVDDDGLADYLAPRHDVVVETDGEQTDEGYSFGLDTGPCTTYLRTLTVDSSEPGHHTVTQTVEFTLHIGIWSILFLPLIKRAARGPGGNAPWWAPPQVLDEQGASSLAALASLSFIAGYLGSLISQTLTFVADEFDASERAQSDTFASVRIGVLAALVIAAWADRHGRRRALLWASVLGIGTTAVGAFVPGLLAYGVTQVFARGMTTALTLLIVVVIAEEMPAGSRAYGVSLLTMAGGLGGGLVLFLLPLLDADERAWRLLYLIPLLFLPLVLATGRILPESRRFVRKHAENARFAGHWGRLGLLAGTSLALAIFGSPAAQLRNEFLREAFDFRAADITIFTVLTVTPGALGIMAGGRLADVHGKRLIGGIGLGAGAILQAVMFVTDSVLVLWVTSAVGSIIGGLAVPALSVYGPELFPTALRTKANVIITVVGVSGSVIGLVVAGRLAERWSLGPGVAALAIVPILAVLLLIPRYPETAHIELEELNPEDALGGAPGLGGPFG